MPTIGKFVTSVLKIGGDREAAQRFYGRELAWLRKNHPEVTDPEAVLQSNIGWCFGEGMPIATRKMWVELTGAVHPGFGPEYAEREFTFEECLQAGANLIKTGGKFHRGYPTAWDLVLRDRFEN